MYISPQAKKTLTELVGTANLDETNPVDLMVVVLAETYAGLKGDIRDYATLIARDMTQVATGANRHPITLTSSSYLDRYNAAVAGLNALRDPLAAAKVAYRRAHNITD